MDGFSFFDCSGPFCFWFWFIEFHCVFFIIIIFFLGGSGWIISVEDYADSFAALGVATPGKLGSSSCQAFMFFILFFVN